MWGTELVAVERGDSRLVVTTLKVAGYPRGGPSIFSPHSEKVADGLVEHQRRFVCGIDA